MPVEREWHVPLNTFIVRFWRERESASVCWHGQVQHVQSGEHAVFTDSEGLLHFIGRWAQLPEPQRKTDLQEQ